MDRGVKIELGGKYGGDCDGLRERLGDLDLGWRLGKWKIRKRCEKFNKENFVGFDY